MRGEIDFAESLHERVATLAGLPESVLADVLAEVEPSPGAAELVAELAARGVARRPGLRRVHRDRRAPSPRRSASALTRANALEVVDGRLTGRVSGAVVDRAAKARTLREYAATVGIPMERTIAIGDGANDIDMVVAAGFGIAYNAKPLLCTAADAVVRDRLDAVLDLPVFAS